MVLDELIDINRYRYNGLTQTAMWSTCPILPKFHTTYGEPIERQEASTEFEANKTADAKKEQSHRLLGRIDFITFNSQAGLYTVTDDAGISLMYETALTDMKALERELLKIMSFYINKLEPMTETDYRNVFPAIDRFAMLRELLVCEDQFHEAKLSLAFAYLECYEHTCDTLEQQRLIQIIVDVMAKRPRLNFEANHFLDSYSVEVQYLQTQCKLVREFI